MIKLAFLAKTSILTAMHETATDLHRLGFIDMHKMRKLDALCLQLVSTKNSKKQKTFADSACQASGVFNV